MSSDRDLELYALQSDASQLPVDDVSPMRGPNCPSTEDLQLLITGELDDDTERRLTLHLDVCRICQRVMDSDTVPESFAQNARERLGRAGDSSIEINGNSGRIAHDAIERDTEFIRNLLADNPPRNGKEQFAVADDESSPGFLGVIKQTGRRTPSAKKTNGDPRHLYRDVENWFDSSDNPDHIGRLGNYEIVDFIGRGGMGVIFKGNDLSLGRTVAIKVLSPNMFADESSVERFIREAQTAAAINHVNVVTIHAVEDQYEIPFLVMEYVEGESLQERIARKGRLEPKEIARIGYQMSSAIAAAHAQNVIHRDLKPANILLDAKNRRLKITDFGLAHVSGLTTLTQTGYLVGTPSFVAPEAVNHEAIDHRSDLFSVGSVLYTIAAGTLPFNGVTPAATLHQIANGAAEPLIQANPDVPEWLDNVVQKLHQHDPALRYQSADELNKYFGQVLRGYQQTTEPVTLPLTDEVETVPERRESTQPALSPNRGVFGWFQRNPGQAATISAIALLSVLVLGGIIANLGSGDTPQEIAVNGRPDKAIESPLKQPLQPRESDENSSKPRIEKEQKALPKDDVVAAVAGPSDKIEVTEPGEADSADDDFPFVIMNADEEAQTFDDLSEAIDASEDATTILIRSNGTIVTDSIEIEDCEITIAAASGFHPTLRLEPEEDEEAASLIRVSHGELKLRGLSLIVDSADDLELEAASAVECYASVLVIDHCRIVAGHETTAILLEECRDAEIKNSLIASAGESSILWGPEHRGTLVIENSAIAGYAMLEIQEPARHLRVDLRNNTTVCEHLIRFSYDRPEQFDGDVKGIAAAYRFQVTASNNIFESFQAMLGQVGVANCRQSEFQSAFTWIGQDNLHCGPMASVLDDEEEAKTPDWNPDDMDQWMAWKNVNDKNSTEAAIEHPQVENGDWEALADEPQRVHLKHFQISTPDEDIEINGGANLAKVGPQNHESGD